MRSYMIPSSRNGSIPSTATMAGGRLACPPECVPTLNSGLLESALYAFMNMLRAACGSMGDVLVLVVREIPFLVLLWDRIARNRRGYGKELPGQRGESFSSRARSDSTAERFPPALVPPTTKPAERSAPQDFALEAAHFNASQQSSTPAQERGTGEPAGKRSTRR